MATLWWILAPSLSIGLCVPAVCAAEQKAPLQPGMVNLKVRALRAGLNLQILDGDHFSTLCVPSCETNAKSGSLLRVAGLRGRTSPRLFVLKVDGGHRAELVVSSSLRPAAAYTATGLGLLVGGALLAGLSPRIQDESGRYAAIGGGAAVAALGLGLGIYGIVLFTKPQAFVASLRDLGAMQP